MHGNQDKLQIIDEETRHYQDLSAGLRFKQNLIHGIGVATVFGIATAACGALFKLATVGAEAAGDGALLLSGGTGAVEVAAAASTLFPLLGIAALVVLGIGCLYFSSKLTSELVRIEQDHQAKQIAKGINGVAPVIETKPVSFPSQSAAQTSLAATPADMKHPLTVIADPVLQNRVVPITVLEQAKG